jgi:hypothetical protein
LGSLGCTLALRWPLETEVYPPAARRAALHPEKWDNSILARPAPLEVAAPDGSEIPPPSQLRHRDTHTFTGAIHSRRSYRAPHYSVHLQPRPTTHHQQKVFLNESYCVKPIHQMQIARWETRRKCDAVTLDEDFKRTVFGCQYWSSNPGPHTCKHSTT